MGEISYNLLNIEGTMCFFQMADIYFHIDETNKSSHGFQHQDPMRIAGAKNCGYDQTPGLLPWL